MALTFDVEKLKEILLRGESFALFNGGEILGATRTFPLSAQQIQMVFGDVRPLDIVLNGTRQELVRWEPENPESPIEYFADTSFYCLTNILAAKGPELTVIGVYKKTFLSHMKSNGPEESSLRKAASMGLEKIALSLNRDAAPDSSE